MKKMSSVLMLIFALKLFLGATYYIAPTGSNSAAGTSAAPWASTDYAYSKMVGGDTLIIKDGTYTGQWILKNTNGIIKPPNGKAGAPTIIKAEHQGMAVFDGQFNMSLIDMWNYFGGSAPGFSYVTIDGIVCRHQLEGAVIYGGNHIYVRGCGFEDSAPGNNVTFSFTHGSYNLAEDCFAWGSGRYKFICAASDHCIFRRCVARMDVIDAGNQPIAAYSIYNSTFMECQNLIAIDSDQFNKWSNVQEWGGMFYTPSTGGQSSDVNWTGCIALNSAMGFGNLTKNMVRVAFHNSVGWHCRELSLMRDPATFDHCTFGDIYGPNLQTATAGLDYWGGGYNPTATLSCTNSIFFNVKGTAIRSADKAWTEDSNDFYGNTADKSNASGGVHDIPANPGLTHIQSSGSSTFGATVETQIGVTGSFWGDVGYKTDTGMSLWPWPNEVVIGQMMGSYNEGGLSGARGFCAPGQTLTNYIETYIGGVNRYSGSTPPPLTPPPPTTLPVDPRDQQISDLTAQVTNLQNQLLSITKQLASSQQDATAKQVTIDGLNMQATALTAQIVTTQALIDSLNAKIANAKAALN